MKNKAEFHSLPDDMHVLNLTIDMPDDEIKGVIVQCHPLIQKANFGAYLTISGYDDDPRELWQIPECIKFMKRLADIGLISILEVSSGLEGIKRIQGRAPGLGAFEVWAFGNKKVIPGKDFKQSIMEFLDELNNCNKRCEEIMHHADKYADKAEGYLVTPSGVRRGMGKHTMPEGQHRHGNHKWQ